MSLNSALLLSARREQQRCKADVVEFHYCHTPTGMLAKEPLLQRFKFARSASGTLTVIEWQGLSLFWYANRFPHLDRVAPEEAVFPVCRARKGDDKGASFNAFRSIFCCAETTPWSLFSLGVFAYVLRVWH